MESTLHLPLDVLLILKTLQAGGFEAYVVGGAVRDVLRETTQTSVIDYDFTTNATPEQIQALFPESYYENEFGTVSITSQELRAQYQLEPLVVAHPVSTNNNRVIDVANASKIHSSLALQLEKAKRRSAEALDYTAPYQITTYRSEAGYTDFRRPSEINWGTSLTDDLSRRDFTINAMAIAVADAFLAEHTAMTTPTNQDRSAGSQVLLTSTDFHIHDPFNGLEDLDGKIIRTVGDPHQRFQEDALRLLRAIRLSVQLGFSLDPETLAAVKRHAALLRHVSSERIRDEFLKILGSTEPKRGIELLDETDLLKIVLPELLVTKGVQQGGHHTTDVWTHSLDALQACPSNDPIVRLATLLHDIAKPQTYDERNGTITFYNHEVLGARSAKQVAQRLKLSKEDTDRIFLLVRFHMFHYQPELTDAAIRRMMRNIQLENIDDILDLREADRLGSGARKTSWRLEELKARMIAQLHQPFAVTDLAINGTDLMSTLGLSPGPMIGQLLQELFEHVMENPEDNQKELLLDLARKSIADERKS